LRKIENGKKEAGKYVLKIDISNFAKGIYHVQMEKEKELIGKKLLR
jgi:hypothetical protein